MLKEDLREDLLELKDAGVKPIFVFPGLDYVNKSPSDSQSHNDVHKSAQQAVPAAELDEARISAARGGPFCVAQMFHQICTVGGQAVFGGVNESIHVIQVTLALSGALARLEH